MSAATFWDGRAGAEKYLANMQERAGVGVSCGSFATEAALNTLKVKRVAFLSPYFPVANDQVRRFYQDCGFTVVRDLCLRRPSPVLIAHSTDDMCRQAIRELDGDDVDAIVQVGTNLSMIRLAAAAELFLGKPVIAINTATYWHALRAVGISDRKAGFGSLMEHH
jgi:maleate isomerase